MIPGKPKVPPPAPATITPMPVEDGRHLEGRRFIVPPHKHDEPVPATPPPGPGHLPNHGPEHKP